MHSHSSYETDIVMQQQTPSPNSVCACWLSSTLSITFDRAVNSHLVLPMGTCLAVEQAWLALAESACVSEVH